MTIRSVFKTPNGTELRLLNLKGKEYLQVQYRIVWFREEHPDWSIETEFLWANDTSACAKAIIRDSTGKVVANGHKSESKQGFADFIEKAETGAIGRALALIGYGTQFCADELDEGTRLADSPVAMSDEIPNHAPVGEDPSIGPAWERYTVDFGRHSGKRLTEISDEEIKETVAWCNKEGKQPRGRPRMFCDMAHSYFRSRPKDLEPPKFDYDEAVPF